MALPERIQRKRTKGWRKPDGAVNVARPSKWGNPFTVENAIDAGYSSNREDAQRLCAVLFRDFMHGSNEMMWHGGEELRTKMRDEMHELRGKDLMCFCKIGTPCHADTLIKLAN